MPGDFNRQQHRCHDCKSRSYAPARTGQEAIAMTIFLVSTPVKMPGTLSHVNTDQQATAALNVNLKKDILVRFCFYMFERPFNCVYVPTNA
jgi:hypothetical protein